MNIASFKGGYVQPNAKSNLMLSGGDDGPGVPYSISSRSNLPFVTLTGANGYQKTISWGEYAVVPCGQVVTVENASAHPGNLIMNAGIEHFSLPSRIIVPTPLLSGGEFGSTQAKYRLDTRRAKRAYLYISHVGALVATVIGRALDSMETVNTIGPPLNGTGYSWQQTYLAGVQVPPIPLGFNALSGDDTRAMAMLDNVQVAFNFDISTSPAFYVAEYL